MAQTTNRITARLSADSPNYKVESQSNQHKLVMDEPLLSGGLNQGPSPFDMVVHSLASCTLITLRMYIENKASKALDDGAQRPELLVELDYRLDDKGIKLLEVKRHVNIRQSSDLGLDESRLLLVANKCPIHNLLAPEVPIETVLSLEDSF